jgi:3',5'-cyclic AMP phosphodiesterase CpdA
VAHDAPAASPALSPAAGRIATPSRILLTPTADPATSQVVSWTMPRRMAGQRVRFRVAGADVARSVPAVRRPATSTSHSGTRAPRYRAILRGLRPGTRYEYRIVTRAHRTPWRSFTTADPSSDEVTLIGLGDTQVDNRGVPRATIRRALADAPDADLVLQAGDVVNLPTRGSEWSALFAAMGNSARTRNWVVSIGNHEQCVLITCSSNRAEAFRSYFDWPTNGFPGQGETWFYTDHQGVRIVVLDSFGGRMAEQAAFLDAALASNRQPWSIVLMHAPPFAASPGRTNADVRRLWLPILEARNVDLVLTGHDHSYARGHLTPGGPVYVTSVSGPKYYAATDADWRAHGATRVAWAARTSTYQVIRISGDTLRYRAVVSHRASGSTSSAGVGEVLDRFTITGTADGGRVVR